MDGTQTSVTLGFDCDQCETKSGFGVEGTCDLVNQECICPEGYSGNDDWIPTHTCHVNDQLAFIIHAVQFAYCIFIALASFVCHLILVKRWNLTLFGFSKNPERRSTRPFGGRQRHRKAKIKQITIISNIWFFFFGLISIAYQAPFLVKNKDGEKWTISDGRIWHPTFLAVACSALMSALYLMLYSWYVTLPDVKAYGGLFKLNPFFIKYPNFIARFCAFMTITAFIFPEIFIIILPAIDDKYLETQAKAFDGMTFLWGALYGVFQFLVATSVITSFKQGIITLDRPVVASPENAKRRERDMKMLRKAIQTTNIFRGINTVFLASSFGLSILWIVIKQNHQYLVFGAIAQGIYMAVAVLPIFIIWRTNGGLVPFMESDVSTNTETNTGMVTSVTKKSVSHDQSKSKSFLNSAPEISANLDI